MFFDRTTRKVPTCKTSTAPRPYPIRLAFHNFRCALLVGYLVAEAVVGKWSHNETRALSRASTAISPSPPPLPHDLRGSAATPNTTVDRTADQRLHFALSVLGCSEIGFATYFITHRLLESSLNVALRSITCMSIEFDREQSFEPSLPLFRDF